VRADGSCKVKRDLYIVQGFRELSGRHGLQNGAAFVASDGGIITGDDAVQAPAALRISVESSKDTSGCAIFTKNRRSADKFPLDLLSIAGYVYCALSAGIGIAILVAVLHARDRRKRKEREIIHPSSRPDEALTPEELALLLKRMEEETWDDL
jgi:hypothetical protein